MLDEYYQSFHWVMCTELQIQKAQKYINNKHVDNNKKKNHRPNNHW